MDKRARIIFIKSFLEKNIGVKNLNHFELQAPYFIFGIKKLKFAVNIETTEVVQYIETSYGSGFTTTDSSLIIQRWIRNSIEEVVGEKVIF